MRACLSFFLLLLALLHIPLFLQFMRYPEYRIEFHQCAAEKDYHPFVTEADEHQDSRRYKEQPRQLLLHDKTFQSHALDTWPLDKLRHREEKCTGHIYIPVCIGEKNP